MPVAQITTLRSMNRVAELNRVGIMVGAGAEGHLDNDRYIGGTPYQQNGLMYQANSYKPLYRYGKRYTKYKKSFNLFVYTDSPDAAGVEKFLDSVKSKIKQPEVNRSQTEFFWLDANYEEK